MTTPIHELHEPLYSSNRGAPSTVSDDEGTLSGEFERTNTNSNDRQNYLGGHTDHSQSREVEHRLADDLAMLQAERVASQSQTTKTDTNPNRSMSMHRSRSRPEPVDQFDVNTNPTHEKNAAFKPVEHPTGNFAIFMKRVHESSFLIRYFTYIVPLVLVILIPLLLGALVFKRATVGGVRLMWFCVWLEVVWLTLWGGRVGNLSTCAWHLLIQYADSCKGAPLACRHCLELVHEQQQKVERYVSTARNPCDTVLLVHVCRDILPPNHDTQPS